MNRERGATPTSGELVKGAEQKHHTQDSTAPTGLSPRRHRLLAALVSGPVPREAADRIAGASNSPQYIAALKQYGLAIVCERVPSTDRDGLPCRPGVYHLLAESLPLAHKLLRGKAGQPEGGAHE